MWTTGNCDVETGSVSYRFRFWFMRALLPAVWCRRGCWCCRSRYYYIKKYHSHSPGHLTSRHTHYRASCVQRLPEGWSNIYPCPAVTISRFKQRASSIPHLAIYPQYLPNLFLPIKQWLRGNLLPSPPSAICFNFQVPSSLQHEYEPQFFLTFASHLGFLHVTSLKYFPA